MIEVTLEQQRAVVKHEIRRREYTFRRRIMQGQATERDCEIELAAMRAVLVTLDEVEALRSKLEESYARLQRIVSRGKFSLHKTKEQLEE